MKLNPLTSQKFPRKIFINPKNFFKIPVQKFSLNIGPGTYNYYNYIYILFIIITHIFIICYNMI